MCLITMLISLYYFFKAIILEENTEIASIETRIGYMRPSEKTIQEAMKRVRKYKTIAFISFLLFLTIVSI